MRPSPVAASAVIQSIRRLGPVLRQDLVRDTHVSTATVARTVSSLLAAGLIRERPDLVPSGVAGRPSLPLEIDGRRHAVLGLHVGKHVLTTALASIDGRVLVTGRSSGGPDGTRSGAAPDPVQVISRALLRCASRFPRHRVLTIGLVGPWGDVPWDPADLRDRVQRSTDLPVAVTDHVAALAAADLLSRPGRTDGSTLYLYARDTMGFVLVRDGRLPEDGKAGRLTHLPTGGDVPCGCGEVGCLGVSAGDTPLAVRAHRAGVVDRPAIAAVVAAARGGDPAALALLRERARILGRATGVLRDMLHPDRIVVAGQAFTGFPAVYEDVLAAFRASTTSASGQTPVDLHGLAHSPTAVQAVAATSCALRLLYADPLAVVGETRALSA
ncbi:ROK family transcriptional regulator [Raineyella fluvialis]|uniref:ROK family transcriptional regulator n=1 Tax=Raineyella fluvialis TaxID=2662261 RepID=UPI00188FD1C6|nr:ROK family transcriptional regulator [Raineyella fluvialis]